MKRVVIEWVEKTSDGMKGIVTLDCFKGGDVTSRLQTFTCNCNIGKTSSGMSGIGPDGVIVPLTEEERRQVYALMQWYLDGRNKKEETYYWFMGE